MSTASERSNCIWGRDDCFGIITFCKVKSDFQRKLNKDLKTIKLSNKTLTPANETSNMYKLTKDEQN